MRAVRLFRAAAGIAAFAACGLVHAFSISLMPSTDTIVQGNNHTFDLVAADVAPEIVSTYDIDVLFDSDFLSYVSGSARFEQGLGSDFLPAEDKLTGCVLNICTLNLFELSALGDADLAARQGTTPFTLVSVTFLALSPTLSGPPTTLTLSINNVGGTTIPGGPTAPLDPSVNGASLTITPRPVSIPEPGSLLLIGAGLSLIAGLRRRIAR